MDINTDDMVMLDGSPVEIWLEGSLIYSPVLWYGVRFEGPSTTGIRTGNLSMHKTLPIQSKFKGCTITSDGVVKYLNPSNWTKYEDGTDVDSALNIMVEVPEYYMHFESNTEEDYVEIKISEYPISGFHLSKKGYVSAYEGYIDDTVLKSVKSKIPTVNVNKESFRTAARANGSAHWNQYTYQMHKALTWCFVVEYANRNSQATFNPNLTEDGYHQGGLGDGVTESHVTINGVITYSFVPTGITDSIGNGTGIVEYIFTNTDEDGTETDTKTFNVPRYRGIENPWGHTYTICDDVLIQAETNDSEDKVYINDNYLTFSNNLSDHTYIGFNVPKTNIYIKQLVNNSAGDIFPYENQTDSSPITYYCDKFYTISNSFSILRMLAVGGYSWAGRPAGWFSSNCTHRVDSTSTVLGSRLTYIS